MIQDERLKISSELVKNLIWILSQMKKKKDEDIFCKWQ